MLSTKIDSNFLYLAIFIEFRFEHNSIIDVLLEQAFAHTLQLLHNSYNNF